MLNGHNKSVKLELLSYFFFSVTLFDKNRSCHIGLSHTGPLDTQQRSSKTKLVAFVSCVLVELCVSGWQTHNITIQYATLRPRHSVFFFFFLDNDILFFPCSSSLSLPLRCSKQIHVSAKVCFSIALRSSQGSLCWLLPAISFSSHIIYIVCGTLVRLNCKGLSGKEKK